MCKISGLKLWWSVCVRLHHLPALRTASVRWCHYKLPLQREAGFLVICLAPGQAWDREIFLWNLVWAEVQVSAETSATNGLQQENHCCRRTSSGLKMHHLGGGVCWSGLSQIAYFRMSGISTCAGNLDGMLSYPSSTERGTLSGLKAGDSAWAVWVSVWCCDTAQNTPCSPWPVLGVTHPQSLLLLTGGQGMWVDVGPDSPRLLLTRFFFSSIFAFFHSSSKHRWSFFSTSLVSLFQGNDGWNELPASELPRNGCSISASPLCCHMCTFDNWGREEIKLRGISTEMHFSNP